MKRLFFIALAFASFKLSFGDEYRIGDFSGGMQTFVDANRIPENAAAYIQNFYTDMGPVCVERYGFIKRDSTVLGAAGTVSGLWPFTDSNGNEWIISFSSRTYYKNTLGGTPTSMALATSAQVPDAVATLGKIWFTNGTDDLWWFDGTSTGTVSTAPHGKLIEAWRNRLAISNITSAVSTVRFSADGDGTSWTIGSIATDPFALSVGGGPNDGQYVRCLNVYQDSLIIGRKYDLWATDGFDQDDIVTRNISKQVGCIEPRTVQEVDGSLLFFSARGLESMTGRSIQMISEPIRNITSAISINTANQHTNTQTSAADWGGGTFDDNVYSDTITYSGRIAFTYPDPFDYFRDGTSGTKRVWGSYSPTNSLGGGGAGASEKAESQSGRLVITSSGGYVFAYTVNPFPPLTIGTTIQISNTLLNNSESFGTTSNSNLFLLISTSVLSGTQGYDINSSNVRWTITLWLRRSTVGTLLTLREPSLNLSTVPAGGISVYPEGGNLSLWISTSNYSIFYGTTTIGVGTHSWGGINKPVYVYIGAQYQGVTNSNLVSNSVSDFQIHPLASTFTWTSSLISIGSLISSWSTLAATEGNVTSAGTITYQLGSTSTASLPAITNYTTVANNAVPTISTNPYAAEKILFQRNVSSAAPYLDDITISWNEGGIALAPVASVYDRRYWLSFTTNTATSILDTVLVYQRNKSFTLFKGIGAASFAIWRDSLYFGNSTSNGYVYKFDTGNNDDGTDITSLVRTRSYDFGQINKDKSFRNAWGTYLADALYAGNFSLSYDVGRTGTFSSMRTVNLNDATGQVAAKFPFPLSSPTVGREVQLSLSKTGTGDRLRLYDFVVEFMTKEAR